MSVWRLPIATILIVVAAGCSGADSGPVFTADEVPSPTPTPTTQLVVPFTTVPPDAGDLDTTATIAAVTEPTDVVFDRLSILDDGTVEIAGTGAISTDSVTIDDGVAAFLTFESTADGGFVATVPIDGAGSHTICIASTCGAVEIDS